MQRKQKSRLFIMLARWCVLCILLMLTSTNNIASKSSSVQAFASAAANSHSPTAAVTTTTKMGATVANDAATATGAATANANDDPSSSLIRDKTVCIVGGGPCGLFLANLLLQYDDSVKIVILERAKAPQQGHGMNAFGLGLGNRLLTALDFVPRLRPHVESVGAQLIGLDNRTLIASRQDLCIQLSSFITNKDTSKRCQIHYGQAVQNIDSENQVIRTQSGHKFHYDLLVGADGVHSVVRKSLFAMGKDEQLYANAKVWKALKLPSQSPNVLPKASFMPLRHAFLSGRILPRHPDGHVALFFWQPTNPNLISTMSQNKNVELSISDKNPSGVETFQDLQTLIRQAMTINQKKRVSWPLLASRWFRNLVLKNVGGETDTIPENANLIFGEEDVKFCLNAKPGRTFTLSLSKHHHDNVVLLGDAAHPMYNFLGQGCACGFSNALQLAHVLTMSPTSKYLLGNQQYPFTSSSQQFDNESSWSIPLALQLYSHRVVSETKAIIDLNLISHVLTTRNWFIKLLVTPLIFIQMLRGKFIVGRTDRFNVRYTDILKDNWIVIWLSKHILWKRQRIAINNKNNNETTQEGTPEENVQNQQAAGNNDEALVTTTSSQSDTTTATTK